MLNLYTVYKKIKGYFFYQDNLKDIKEHINKIAPTKPLDKKVLKKITKSIKKNAAYYKNEKENLMINIHMNISQLHPIAESLFEKGLQKYYEKVIDLIEQSEGFSRILKRLDINKPYAPQIITTINRQTSAINQLIIKLYSK